MCPKYKSQPFTNFRLKMFNGRRLHLVVFFFIIFLNSIAFSQEKELTLKICIDNALKTNPSIIKSLNSIEAQESNIKTSYGNLFPTVSFSSGWTRTNQITTSGEYSFSGVTFNLGRRDTTTDNYNLSLRSDIKLFDGFSNYENIELSRKIKTNLLIQLEKNKQDIILNIISSYINTLKNQQVVKINEATLVDSKSQLEKIKKFVEVGKKTVSDIYKQEVLVGQNELSLEQSKNNFNKSLAELVFNSNLPQDEIFTVSKDEFNTALFIEDLQLYIERNSDLELLVQTALKNRNDYKTSVQNLDILETNLSISRNSVIFPTLSGFSSYSLSGSKIQNINDSRVFTVGLTLSYPIFQGFSLDNQRQQAEIKLKSANEDLRQLKNQITLDIKKVILDLKSLAKQIEIADKNIKASEQDKILAEESYRVGLGILLDVQTATVKYNNLLIEKSNLIFNFILVQNQLEYYKGLLK